MSGSRNEMFEPWPEGDGAVAAIHQLVVGSVTRLLYAVIEINAWNRLPFTAASPEPGTFLPSRKN